MPRTEQQEHRLRTMPITVKWLTITDTGTKKKTSKERNDEMNRVCTADSKEICRTCRLRVVSGGVISRTCNFGVISRTFLKKG